MTTKVFKKYICNKCGGKMSSNNTTNHHRTQKHRRSLGEVVERKSISPKNRPPRSKLGFRSNLRVGKMNPDEQNCFRQYHRQKRRFKKLILELKSIQKKYI